MKPLLLSVLILLSACTEKYQRSDNQTTAPIGHKELCISTDPERQRDRELFCEP